VRYFVPLALVLLLAAVVVVALTPRLRLPIHLRLHNPLPAAAKHAPVTVRHLPPYWFVRPNDTLVGIANKTGLTVAQLQAFNPQADPSALLTGQRLNLWRHPPRPVAPVHPEFWTVRSGQSLAYIAEKSGTNLATLEQLNAQLNPNAIQPGQRIRLRH
jgi:LysM repeat protein